MGIPDKINDRIRKLPESAQAEVLHFVEFLLHRSAHSSVSEENREWAIGSLSSAVKDVESEDDPKYTESDIKEHFS